MNEIRPDSVTVRQLSPAPRSARCGGLLRSGRIAAAILALLLAPAHLFAQFALWPTAPQTPLPAVVRVISPERDGASLGSGTLVDVSPTHGLVLTNWHVVRDAAGNVIVSFPDGFQTPGYVLKMDRNWDLAAVAIWRPHVSPVPIAAEAPRPGEILTIAGYGAGNYRAISGPCTEYLSPGPNFPYEIVELHAAARHGDSGGPILNSRGELAGVLFGEGGGDTSGTFCGRVRMFLSSIGQGTSATIAATSPPPSARPILPSSAQPIMPQSPAALTAAQLSAAGLPTSHSNSGLLADSSKIANWPCTTNYPPISLPIGTLSRASPAGGQDYAASPPPPAAESPCEQPTVDPHAAGPLAAIVSPLPPMPAADRADSTGRLRPGQSSEIGWEQIAGHTFGDQLKTVLAGVGAILVVLQIIRKLV